MFTSDFFLCYLYLIFQPYPHPNYAVSEERCNEVESLVFDLFASLGATGADFLDLLFVHA